jgi:hypothetical protein
VMRSNLELFLERLPMDLEPAASPVAPDRVAPRRPSGISTPRASLTRTRRPVGSRQRT